MINSDDYLKGSLYHPDDNIGFGKYKYQTWAEVKESDPGYLMWMAGASDDMPGRKKFIDSLFTVQIDLMPDQLAAADAITDDLINGDHRVHRLQGGAGYGKSYTVMEIAQRAKRAGFNVVAMANSYVATQVLAESLTPVGVEAHTIARSLALRPDTSGFAESYGPSPETDQALDKLLANGNLLIVDEDSMCSDAVVELVYGKMNEPGNTAKLLSVGDGKQLPSPEQDDLCEFCAILPSFELTIPKRYEADSDLHMLEKLVREDPFTLPAALEKLHTPDGQIVKQESFQSLCEQMIEDIHEYPKDTGLMLFYRRDAVANANRAIRKMAYGEGVDPIVEDERLRVMRTSFLPVGWDHANNRPEVIKFYSGTFVTARFPRIDMVIVDFDQEELPPNDLQPIAVNCYTTRNGEDKAIPLIFSKSEHSADPATVGGQEFNAGLQLVKEYCMEINNWKLYHYYRSKFVQISYGYATTVHRSQGSSVDRIYFNPKDVLTGGAVAPKLAYVAATRAKKQLHFTLGT